MYRKGENPTSTQGCTFLIGSRDSIRSHTTIQNIQKVTFLSFSHARRKSQDKTSGELEPVR